MPRSLILLYAWIQLTQAEAYALSLPAAAFEALIHIPLALAKATLDALARGEAKLSRGEVLCIVQQIPAKEDFMVEASGTIAVSANAG